MSIKSIALAGAALFVLTASTGVALAHPQDEQVRQLNLEQLRKAQAARGVTTSEPSMPASETTTPDGKGGPELQGPPSPEEGMTDEGDKPVEGGTPAPTDQEPATTPPPTTQPE
jgi:hypothetical protein